MQKIAWIPHNYQKKVVKMMLESPAKALFMSPGTGKTASCLQAHKLFIAKNLLRCGLVVAPLRVMSSTWPRELEKWTNFEGLTLSTLHGARKEQALEAEADLYIINPEGLPWLLSHPLFKKRFKDQALYIDESTKFKNPASQRFKLLRQVLHLFSRRYILTGTPAPNGLLDLFSQVYILDEGKRLGRYVTHYRNRYFYQSWPNVYEWKLQPGAAAQIHAAIEDISIRLDAKDYLELPKLIVNDIYLDLPPAAQKVYDDMEKELYAAVNRQEVTAASAGVASGKCSQIANGGIYDEAGKYHFIHDLKAEAVGDLVEELSGSPALVAYEFDHDLARLKAILGKDSPHIGGGVTPRRAAELEAAWNRGELPVLLGQPASIAHGLNIQEAGNNVIWHSLTFNFEYYDQFIQRVLRQGNTHDRVFVHRLIMRNTVDELKIQALNNKFHTQNDLFDALKDYLQRKGFAFGEKASKGRAGNHADKPNSQGEKKMGKFDRKAVDAVEGTTVKKEKIFTNDPELQNQDTGEVTEAGKAFKEKKDNVSKFERKPTVKAPAKKAAKPAAKKPAVKVPAKKAAKKVSDSEGGPRGKVSPYLGKRVKILKKGWEPREGSFQAAGVAVVYHAKKVDDALGQTFKAGGKEGIVGSVHVFRAIEQGLIEVA